MRDQYEQSIQHQKRQMQFADNYRLSQTIEDHNKYKSNWRNLVKMFNRNR